MNLTNSQKKTVDSLFLAYHNRLQNKEVWFKAPTGSGKTFMSSELISRIFLEELTSDEKTIVIFATISNAELPRELARKLTMYKKFHQFNDYKIEHVVSPSKANLNLEDINDFVLEDNKVFVFGTSSFGANTLFHSNKTLETLVDNAKANNFNIVFIRDEAHIGAKEKISKADLKNFDQILFSNSVFAIKMTATPSSENLVIELDPNDLANDDLFLLKNNMVKTKLEPEISNEELIDSAISEFKKSKKDYSKLDDLINPAMLIQVMNEDDYKKDPIKNRLFHEGLELLEEKLSKAGLKYLKYINAPVVKGTKVPATLEYASRKDSQIDAIIFKVGPATGWDIPRANTLLQLRNVSSESLNIQTLGRIMRNPYKNLEFNEITDKYYLYSNYQKPTRFSTAYYLKEQFKNKKMISGYINQESRTIYQNYSWYFNNVIEYIQSNSFINKLKDSSQEDFSYETVKYSGSKVINLIPNHVFLKIYNDKKVKELDKELNISDFFPTLNEVSNNNNIDFEKTLFYFIKSASKLREIKSKNSDWMKSDEPYELNMEVGLLDYYSIWVDNDNPKKVNTSQILNYGYMQIGEEKDIQYLDSEPELSFFKKFINVISEEQREGINFYAKMPTLGSKVYFEYYSKSDRKISKSYMDFSIEYKGKIIMVEVKSKDSDYNPEKTKDLLLAYNKYMEKFSDKNISLVLYEYDKNEDTNFVTLWMDDEWREGASFREAFDYLLK